MAEFKIKNYLLMPERGRWYPTTASSPEMAYRANSSWYSADQRIAVLDPDTMEVFVFTSVLDRSGNHVKTVRLTGPDLLNSQ